MYWVRPGDDLPWEFTTSHPNNGQSVSADALPVVVLARNGVLDEDVIVAVELIETGRYLATCTIPDEYNPGDVISLRATAIVAGVTGRDTLFQTRLFGIDFTQVAGVKLVLGPAVGSVAGSGEVSDGGLIVAYHYAPLENITIAVMDDQGEPFDLSEIADDLAFVVFGMRLDIEVTIAELYGSDVVVDEEQPHQVTLLNTTPLNQQLGDFRWALRRRTEGQKVLRAQGCYSVRPCADVTEPE